VVSADQRVILKVGDLQVTQAAFETMIKTLEETQGTPADLSRKALGDNYASLLALSQAALANHLESTPDVIEQLAIDRTQILSNAEFGRLKAEAKPSAQEISAYYNAHLEDFDTVQVKRLFIWVRPDETKEGKGMTLADAKALADAVQMASAKGEDPKKLIPQSDNVLYDGQALSFQRGEMPVAMDKAAFALTKPGEWTQLDKNVDGLVLLQLVSRGRRDLKEVSKLIDKKLESDKLKAELDDLKKKSGVWMDETYFASKTPLPAASTDPDSPGPSKAVREDKDADKSHQ
jgi:hypothetical protein